MTARDPVAVKARVVAGAFRAKGLGEVGDMIDYLADRADLAWEIDDLRARLAVAERAEASKACVISKLKRAQDVGSVRFRDLQEAKARLAAAEAERDDGWSRAEAERQRAERAEAALEHLRPWSCACGAWRDTTNDHTSPLAHAASMTPPSPKDLSCDPRRSAYCRDPRPTRVGCLLELSRKPARRRRGRARSSEH